MNERILCVEDDPDIGKLLLTLLDEAGYACDWVADGAEALKRWPQASLVLLDLMLPKVDGLTICQKIREQDTSLPLIMLTAKAGTHDVVRGLELGADDYITKPFDAPVLLARIKALLRRHRHEPTDHADDAAVIRCQQLEIDSTRHRVTLAANEVPLTTKEFALLTLFARHPGRCFSRGELLDQVWGPDFDGFDHTVNTHINRLRGKIEADPAKPHFIHTVWGVGYRFCDTEGEEPSQPKVNA